MKWASCISTQETIEACVEEAVASVTQQLAGRDADLTIIFVSPHFRTQYRAIPQLLKDRMPVGLLLGCSGGGIIGGGKEIEQKPAFSLTAAHLPGVELQTIQTDTMNLPDPDTAPSVWQNGWEWTWQKIRSFIVLADPFSFRAEEFLAGMDFAYSRSAKVGGLASGAQAQGGNALYLDDKIYNGGLIGVALSGNIQLDTIVAQGCRPIGQPMSITKCDQYQLLGVDGQPPLEKLERNGRNLERIRPRTVANLPFSGNRNGPDERRSGPGGFPHPQPDGRGPGNGFLNDWRTA